MSFLFNLSVYINILVLSKISKNKIFFEGSNLSVQHPQHYPSEFTGYFYLAGHPRFCTYIGMILLFNLSFTNIGKIFNITKEILTFFNKYFDFTIFDLYLSENDNNFKKHKNMNIVKINEDRINSIIPKHINESDVLDKYDKKVLGAILHYFLVLDKAKENKYVILTNDDLRKTIGIRKASMLLSIQKLTELGLIKRECGKTWREGEKPQASKYFINWDNLKRPLKKPEFEDLFSDFLSSETPMGTIDIDTDSDIDSESDKDTVTDTVQLYYST